MRLIDADALLKYAGNCYDEDGHLLYAVGTGTIMRMQTIDAVPVVRCFECKAFLLKAEKPRYMCCKFNGLTDPKPNNYCSYGERRSDDADQ